MFSAKSLLIAAALISISAGANAQSVQFSSVSDSAAGNYLSSSSGTDPLDANTLILGIAQDPFSGGSGFRVFGNSASFDTVAIKASAPAGFYIQSIAVRHQGAVRVQGATTRGAASGENHVSINGIAHPAVTLSGSNFDSIKIYSLPDRPSQVSISVGMVLKSRQASTGGSISVQLDSSSVKVNLAPLP